ncbi:MAG: PH domain-containing protein [Gemmatimonadetes bacterium]|nr:PH domain-containing protein [Gemmatimonadota bacterium]MYD15105.1 PH domain-containing protein [Gemmatimonadota bacterium]MYI65845.1 PH domain-containing protein [Gemmatimonadota bacterium]
MNPAVSGDWQRLSPFAILSFVGLAVKIFARGAVQGALPVVAAILLLRDDEPLGLGRLLPVIGGLLMLVAVIAVIQWAYFKFRIAEDRLLIRKGFIKKTSLDLPYERVQGINVERSLVDRIIGLVSVTLDTAGSVQAEGKLPSVTTEVADHLRASVAALGPGLAYALPEGGTGEAWAPGAEGAPSDAGADAVAAARAGTSAPAGPRLATRPHWGRVLLKLGPADMVRIGLANRNFIFVAAMVGILTDLVQPGDFLDPLLEALAAGVDSAAGAFSGLGALAQLVVVVVLVGGALAAALILTVTAAFLRHHAFTLWHDGRTFRSRAGLLTQREVVVEAPKIQQLTVSQDLVLRWFGRFRLRALPAAAVVGQQGGQNPGGLDVADVLDVPLLDGRRAEEVRARVFRREAREIAVLPRDGAFRRVSPHYIRALALRIWLTVGLVLAGIFLQLLLSGVSTAAGVPMLIGWLASIPVVVLVAWQLWRRRGYTHDDNGLASRGGFIGSKVDAFPLRKAQSAIVKRSPLQRRKGLATLQVHLACGKVTVPYIEHKAARRLRDYILYRVEATRRRWH